MEKYVLEETPTVNRHTHTHPYTSLMSHHTGKFQGKFAPHNIFFGTILRLSSAPAYIHFLFSPSLHTDSPTTHKPARYQHISY